MLSKVVSKTKLILPIMSHNRNIVMNQYEKKIEYRIPLYGEALKNKFLYTVRIDGSFLKIVFLDK